MRRRVGALGAAVAMVAALLSACSSEPDWTPPADEPSHRIDYFIFAVGTANDELEITYTEATGAQAQATTPAVAGFWSKTITTTPGVEVVGIQASGSSSDLAFRIVCTITVDGVKTEQRGDFSCSHSVDLPKFRTAHPSLPASGSPSPSPTATRSFASPPASCRYVSEQEATDIVAASAGGVIKPVLSTSGDDTKCTYVFEYQTGRITFSWKPGGKAQPGPGIRVPDLGGTAYWTDGNIFSTLEVQLPKGLFTVDAFFEGLRIDQKAATIAIFKAARPRLP